MRILFLLSLFNATEAKDLDFFTSAKECKIRLLNNQIKNTFEASCNGVVKKFELLPNEKLKESYVELEKFVIKNSKSHSKDRKKLQNYVLSHFEKMYQFEYPGDKFLISYLVNKVESIPKNQMTPALKCKDSIDFSPRKNESYAITPYVDLNFDLKSKKELERELVDIKMAKDGFINLGKVKGVNLGFHTENDNFLHGVGRKLIKDDSKLPWWEGDDRGKTFTLSPNVEIEYENGSIKVAPYSTGYGELTKVNGKIKDKEGKLYQNFISVDGVEIELRLNETNGDKYVKVIGVIENTSSKNGLASKIQDAWHKSSNSILYNYVDHRKDEITFQGGVAVGIEKESTPLSWLGVKAAIEGSAHLNTSGLDDSFIGLNAEIAVNTNQLLSSDNNTPPLLEAVFSADHKHFGNGQNYTNLGVTIYGTVYSDKNGNVVKVYAGAEEINEATNVEYAQEEIGKNNRADLNHILGIKFEKKF